MKTTLPEKTLEHWTSLYVTYRFHSKAALWWPPFGEDISYRGLANAPAGKFLSFEVKTSYWDKSSGRHVVSVDVPQLKAYLKLPVSRRPYYVFPIPSWSGYLEDFARTKSVSLADLAVRRGKSLWAARWTYVLSADTVNEIVGGSRRTRGSAQILSVQPRADLSSPKLTWTRGKNWKPRGDWPMRWCDFWDKAMGCGEKDWNQAFYLPRGYEASSYEDIRWNMAEVGRLMRQRSFDLNDSVVLDSREKGIYKADVNMAKDGWWGRLADVEGGSSRVSVFLSAEALDLGE